MNEHRRRLILRLLAVPLIVVLGAVGWAIASFYGGGAHDSDVTVLLPRGAGVDRIADVLNTEGVLSSPLLFRVGVRLAGNSRALKAGEYLIPEKAGPRAIMNLLLSGRTVQHRLTVAEGLSAAEILNLLRETGGLEGEIAELPSEGVLLPETYYFALGDSRGALIERMGEAMREVLDELWSDRAEGLPFDTPQEALTLASIVEKETAVAGERPRIAAVFINRLRRGMRLQSDPTVVYSITLGAEPLGRSLKRRDLRTQSPYNTYVSDGLPPGPIANPGRAAIEAVLHPSETDELYFVADGNGGHAFARTLDEHEKNIARWLQIRRKNKK